MDFIVSTVYWRSKAEFFKKKIVISPMSALWTTLESLDLMYVMEKIINLNIAIKVVLRRAYTVL